MDSFEQNTIGLLDDAFQIVDRLNSAVFMGPGFDGSAVRHTMSDLGVRRMILAHDRLAKTFGLPAYDGLTEVVGHYGRGDSALFHETILVVKGVIAASGYRMDARQGHRDAIRSMMEIALADLRKMIAQICKENTE